MDSLTPQDTAAAIDAPPRPPRVWKFWGTALWGLLIFVAMFVGQVAVVIYRIIAQGGELSAGGIT
ncbi:MAG TPA: CPBP family intramembrane glutamate endopeptidase, partial [Bradyrhizobium sp.]